LPTGPFPLAEPSSLSKPVTFVTLNRTPSASSKLETTVPRPRLQGFALCEDSPSSGKG
jgi:hypothetical protein